METAAIVIGLMDYREADRIVTLFTREHGKIRGIARGAKRSMKRFGGALELFARLTVRFDPREGLVTIKDADIVTIFPGIRKDLTKIAHGGYGCELLDALVPEGCGSQRLFRLFEAYLEQLDQAVCDPSDRRFFEINLLNILGYRPPVGVCSTCGAALAEGGRWAGTPVPEVRCRRCAGGGLQLSGATVAGLLRCLQTGRFGSVRFTPQELAEAADLLDAAISANLQRPLKSLAFLRLSP